MAETVMFEALLGSIPKEWDSISYVLCGSAVLAVNSVRDVDDLDLLVHPSLWPDIRKRTADCYWPVRHIAASTEEAERAYKTREVFRTGYFDFFMTLPHISGSVSYIQALQESTEYKGHRILSVKHLLAIKALAGRKKDILDIRHLATML